METEWMEAETVSVRRNAAEFSQEIVVGRHRFMGDEPASAGGTATGPDP
jgi:hypothetical protein